MCVLYPIIFYVEFFIQLPLFPFTILRFTVTIYSGACTQTQPQLDHHSPVPPAASNHALFSSFTLRRDASCGRDNSCHFRANLIPAGAWNFRRSLCSPLLKTYLRDDKWQIFAALGKAVRTQAARGISSETPLLQKCKFLERFIFFRFFLIIWGVLLLLILGD